MLRFFSTRTASRLAPLLRGFRRRPQLSKVPHLQQQRKNIFMSVSNNRGHQQPALSHSTSMSNPRSITASFQHNPPLRSSSHASSSSSCPSPSARRWLGSSSSSSGEPPAAAATSGRRRLAAKAKALGESVRGGGDRVSKKIAAAVHRSRQRPNWSRTLRRLAASGVFLWVLSKGSWGFVDDIQFVQGSKVRSSWWLLASLAGFCDVGGGRVAVRAWVAGWLAG